MERKQTKQNKKLIIKKQKESDYEIYEQNNFEVDTVDTENVQNM